ncbi:MAG: hypothetical protein K0S37_770 [Microbacterium sp.]|jgi:hypothetical protein|nr:hypothetical protein [Microbacterium sp.]
MRCDEGKTRYATQHDAIKTIIVWAWHRTWKKPRAGRLATRPYRCPFCGSWHVTGQRKRARS